MNDELPRWKLRLRALIAVVAAGLVFAPNAWGGISDDVLVISASSAEGKGNLTIRFADCTYDPAELKLVWEATSAIDLVDPANGNVIGTVQSGNVIVRKFVRMNLVLELSAGGAETTFTVDSPQLSFDAVAADIAEGEASASLSASDLDGDGFRLTGPSGALYRARFNGRAPLGVAFADLLGNLEGSGGTSSALQREPAFGARAFGAEVRDISFQLNFALTDRDQVSMSFSYRLRPEPECTVDSDGDLTPDCVDACPGDSAKVQPGQCGCGILETGDCFVVPGPSPAADEPAVEIDGPTAEQAGSSRSSPACAAAGAALLAVGIAGLRITRGVRSR